MSSNAGLLMGRSLLALRNPATRRGKGTHNVMARYAGFSSSELSLSKMIMIPNQQPRMCVIARSIASTSATASSTSSASGSSRASSSSSSSSSSSRPWLRYGLAGGAVVGVAGAYGYVHNELGGHEGIYRSLSFYSKAIPRYLEYRYLQIFDKPDDHWEELDERASAQGLDKIMELRGFYIKAGQMAASNIGNGFPRIWQDTLSVLQDQCPHKDFAQVKAIIEEEFQKPLTDIFEWVEEKPLGAASIGQVHKAKLKKTGEIVVVKVMYPEAEQVFRGDVRTLKMFCQVAQPVHVPALEQTEKHFMSEFDYRREAEQQERIRRNLIKAGLAGDGPKSICKIPRINKKWCSKRAVVMEYFEGDKLADGLMKDMIRHAARQGKSPQEFRAEEDKLDKEARYSKTLRHGPTAKEFQTYIAFMDAKRRTANLWKRVYNLSLGWWMPGATPKPIQTNKALLPINQAQVVDDLMHIHGHQIVVDGCFNGDPHPGNLLLLDADKGKPKLGLIDYGQVKVLEKKDRILFCKLIIALDEDNRPDIIRLMKQAGYKSKYMNEDNIYRYAKVYYDEDSYDLTWGLHIQVFVEALEAIDPIIEVPDEFIMIGRACLMLRGLAHALHQSRSCAKAWRPMAEQVLRKEGIPTKRRRPMAEQVLREEGIPTEKRRPVAKQVLRKEGTPTKKRRPVAKQVKNKTFLQGLNETAQELNETVQKLVEEQFAKDGEELDTEDATRNAIIETSEDKDGDEDEDEDKEPVDEEPVDEEPVDEEPVDEEPVDEEPVAEEPVDEEPVDEEPVDEEPVDEEPVDEEPVDEEPVDEDEAV